MEIDIPNLTGHNWQNHSKFGNYFKLNWISANIGEGKNIKNVKCFISVKNNYHLVIVAITRALS